MIEKEIKPILKDTFCTDGRGPELIKAHWAYSGTTLRAIDFLSTDDSELKHLFFVGVQVIMFTPEEIINYVTLSSAWDTFRPAGILCMGKSDWLNSFSQRHLEKCSHYQIMFYDDLLDIICEKIELRNRGYLADATK